MAQRQRKSHAPSRTRTPSRQAEKSFQRYRSVGGRKAEKSERSQRRSLLLVRRKLTFILSGVLLALGGLLFVLFQFVTDVAVNAHDISRADDAGYEKSINQYFKRNPLQRLRINLDLERLTQSLQRDHPEVEKLETKKSTKGTLFVELSVRQAAASWKVGKTNQYVDSHGVIFDTNYGKDPEIKIVDNSGLDYGKSSAVASQSFLTFTGQLVGLGDKYDYRVKSVSIPRGAIRDVEVRFKGQPYLVRMNTSGEAGEQYEDASRVMDWLDKTDTSAKSIDVRVSRRASYR